MERSKKGSQSQFKSVEKASSKVKILKETSAMPTEANKVNFKAKLSFIKR
jgi:hypothetical protein